jgi:hypothetical protein
MDACARASMCASGRACIHFHESICHNIHAYLMARMYTVGIDLCFATVPHLVRQAHMRAALLFARESVCQNHVRLATLHAAAPRTQGRSCQRDHSLYVTNSAVTVDT